jgi:hypothetical protein
MGKFATWRAFCWLVKRSGLRFIRRFACCACGSTRAVEAAHIGPHGLGQKASDLSALPLCEACHRTGPQSLHRVGPVEFQRIHERNFARLIQWFNALFRRKL